MIYQMVPFSITLNNPDFKGTLFFFLFFFSCSYVCHEP